MSKSSVWVIILLAAIVALVALVAYTRMHPAPLPNFHW